MDPEAVQTQEAPLTVNEQVGAHRARWGGQQLQENCSTPWLPAALGAALGCFCNPEEQNCSCRSKIAATGAKLLWAPHVPVQEVGYRGLAQPQPHGTGGAQQPGASPWS